MREQKEMEMQKTSHPFFSASEKLTDQGEQSSLQLSKVRIEC